MNFIAFRYKTILLAAILYIALSRGTVRQIQDGTAAGANEMSMGPNIPIVSLLAVDYADPLDQPLL